MSPRRRMLFAAAAAWGLGAARAAQSASAKPTVVLGQSVPLTGAASEIGLAYAAGAKLYVDAFNARSDSPVRIELRQLDDGYDAARAGANAKTLLAAGADMLFGFVGTASANAAAAVAREQGVVLLAPFAAADALRDPAQSSIFHVRPSMGDEAFKMVQHCATIGLSRIAVLAEDDAMGRAGLDAVNRAIAELKLPALAGAALVPSNSDKVDAAVTALRALQPQAIIQVALFKTTASFVQKMRKSGYGGTFLNFSSVGIDPLYVALGKDIQGVVVSQVVPSPRSTGTPIVREYLAAIEDSDQAPSYESLEGFIAAKALGEAVRRSGRGANRATLQKALGGMTAWDAGGLRINLRGGAREAASAIDLITFNAEGRVIR